MYFVKKTAYYRHIDIFIESTSLITYHNKEFTKINMQRRRTGVGNLLYGRTDIGRR
jgi:hypothetical protein